MKNRHFHLFAFFGILFFISCTPQYAEVEKIVSRSTIDDRKIQRFGMVTGLKPEKVAYYKQLHAAVWPGVQRKIKDCNIQNYSIYFKEIEGKPFLFSYFEYAGTDFDRDMINMTKDSITRLWWNETDPCQQPLPDATAKKQVWSVMDAVFHLD